MADASEPQGTHFFFISVNVKEDQGVGSHFFQGTWTPSAGATRQDVFGEILQEIIRTDPRVGDRQFVVVAFDIQPNQL